jgi:hypothetical protein
MVLIDVLGSFRRNDPFSIPNVHAIRSAMMMTALRVLFLGSLVGAVAWLAVLGWLSRDHD